MSWVSAGLSDRGSACSAQPQGNELVLRWRWRFLSGEERSTRRHQQQVTGDCQRCVDTGPGAELPDLVAGGGVEGAHEAVQSRAEDEVVGDCGSAGEEGVHL